MEDNDSLRFTPKVLGYVKNLPVEKCERVTVTGGEPLLYMDKVKELFAYVPKGIKKRVLTNGTLLDEGLVRYFNDNDVELQVSHDGPLTEFLRGVDVLKEERTRNLIMRLKHVRFNGVVTRYNVDVWENFFDVAKKLGRSDFGYNALPVFGSDISPDLVNGFDYATWFRTWMQFTASPYSSWPLRPNRKRKLGFYVLPNGNLCGKSDCGSVYGTVFEEDMDKVFGRMVASGDSDYCFRTGCAFKDTCEFMPQGMSEHTCRWRRLVMRSCTPDILRSVRGYVLERLPEIREKYGFVDDSVVGDVGS